MRFGWMMLVLFTGLLMPIQAAVNARLRTFVVNPMYSALISFSIGTASLMALAGLWAWRGEPGNLAGAARAPWWAWIGGFFGAIFVTVALMAVPRIGTASSAVAVISGQLIAALVIDHFGWFGLPVNPLTPQRTLGVILLMVAIWLFQR